MKRSSVDSSARRQQGLVTVSRSDFHLLQLKKLEDYLGGQLIERQPKNVSLTEAGEQIVSRARRMLEASEEVVTLARAHRDPLAGRLRVALLPTIGPYLLPRVWQLEYEGSFHEAFSS